MTPLIGLTGRAGSGKDTVGAALTAEFGYARVAFADAIKTAAYAADPLVYADGSFVRLSALVDSIGWDEAKSRYRDVRRYLQRHGVAMRDAIPGCWADIATRKISAYRDAGTPIVVTDVRFADEVFAIRWLGGIVVKLTRDVGDELPGELGAHVSEQVDALVVDRVEANNGSALVLARHLHLIASYPLRAAR